MYKGKRKMIPDRTTTRKKPNGRTEPGIKRKSKKVILKEKRKGS